MLRLKRKPQISCLSSCVAWAITLREPRLALFISLGTLIPFVSIISKKIVPDATFKKIKDRIIAVQGSGS